MADCGAGSAGGGLASSREPLGARPLSPLAAGLVGCAGAPPRAGEASADCGVSGSIACPAALMRAGVVTSGGRPPGASAGRTDWPVISSRIINIACALTGARRMDGRCGQRR